MDEVLLIENRGAVRLLTMNRPAKLNALNADLVHALTEELLAAQDDNAVSAIVLAGARSDSRWVGWISGCADGCIRFAEGGDARPRLVGAAAARPG